MASSLPTQEEVPRIPLESNLWLCWREEERVGKSMKRSINFETGEFASMTDTETWTSFETAREQV